MTRFPIVAHYLPRPGSALADRAVHLATKLHHEQSDLVPRSEFRRLMPVTLEDRPTLHLDDLSTIVQLDRLYEVTFLEDRARFRAMDGDIVASCTPRAPSFETYCEQKLGLGHVTWLRPHPGRNRLSVATACWNDRETRHALVRACRHDDLVYVHPHMGNFPSWALALLLQRTSRQPLSVIAPPPGLTNRVNDKLWFTDVVRRLFGGRIVPPTAAAYNLTTVARLVAQLAVRSRSIVFKLPDSAGGAGNLVCDTRRFQGRSIGQLRLDLRKRLTGLGWTGATPLLVSSWETAVLTAPSTQLWIPPLRDGPPVLEGVFQQLIEGDGEFTGCCAATLPADVTQEMVERSWLLALVFQHLGYVGRCSFDLILVGRTLADCRVEFIECNGRWGGTSLPMTLMNRLFGDWTRHPYAVNEYGIGGLKRFDFADLLTFFEDGLYDARTGRGDLIFFNPAALQTRPGIDVIAMADTWQVAQQRTQGEIPRRLEGLARSGRVASKSLVQIR